MKLIDIVALRKEMYRKSFEVDDGRSVWNSGFWIRYQIFEEASRDAPIVDAEPVRYGSWIQNEFGTTCSACGLYSYRDEFDHPWESPYCPHCGAKMDAERKEEK